ncbi:MAG: helix-turn-helix domain-containing protein [Oligoflexus sp.]
MEPTKTNSVEHDRHISPSAPELNRSGAVSTMPSRGININDHDLISRLDRYSIEDVVELKISRFLDQIGTFYPENVHELIMSKVEKPLLIQILRRVGGNQVQAAKILGINRNTLRKKIKIYGIL